MAKHKSGYDILKEKLENKQAFIEMQESHIASLKASEEKAWDMANERHQLALDYWQHMGAFRRWTWRLKHKG